MTDCNHFHSIFDDITISTIILLAAARYLMPLAQRAGISELCISNLMGFIFPYHTKLFRVPAAAALHRKQTNKLSFSVLV